MSNSPHPVDQDAWGQNTNNWEDTNDWGEDEKKEASIWGDETYTENVENELQYNINEENVIYQRLGIEIQSMFSGEMKLSEPRRPREEKSNFMEKEWGKEDNEAKEWGREDNEDKECDRTRHEKGWGNEHDSWGN